jgi:hypothetical protein
LNDEMRPYSKALIVVATLSTILLAGNLIAYFTWDKPEANNTYIEKCTMFNCTAEKLHEYSYVVVIWHFPSVDKYLNQTFSNSRMTRDCSDVESLTSCYYKLDNVDGSLTIGKYFARVWYFYIVFNMIFGCILLACFVPLGCPPLFISCGLDQEKVVYLYS